jgi:diketogulonate reductase-like aldo/keto reductase
MSQLKHAPLVHANGMDIPAIGLGTFRAEGEEATKSVIAAIKTGYRHIDTARMYGNEREVGEGVRASGVARSDLFITTKVLHGAEWDNQAVNTVLPAIEDSLKRLQMDYVDLLLIHWPHPTTPIKDTMADLCAAKRKGYARHIGISNFTLSMVDEAVHHATEQLSNHQCEYHPYLDQSKLRAKTLGHGLSWTSFCPIGKGAAFEDPVILSIAKAHQKKPSQIIMRWQVQQPGTVAVPKSVNPDRIAENFDVFDFTLSDQEMAAISALKKPDGRIVSPPFAPKWDV